MPDPLDDPTPLAVASQDEEALFARAEDGRLIRADAPTLRDLGRRVKLRIDESDWFTVPKAVPATDAQGNLLYHPDDTPVVRATTIYDAARSVEAVLAGLRPRPDEPPRIPVLCHRDHLTPVAVCRVCAVQIVKPDPRRPDDPTKQRVERKLLPACQHRVEDGMIVHTLFSPDDKYRPAVRASVQVLYDLLAGDHLHPSPAAGRFRNELDGDAAALGAVLRSSREAFPQDGPATGRRFTAKPADPARIDAPSDAPFAVDHNACILCDRCGRSCEEVKPFRVIGRSGKGADTRIAFDLAALPMAASSCRQCGECMTACPTGAIRFQGRVFDGNPARLDAVLTANGRLPPAEVVEADELLTNPLFARLSKAFLEWNRGAVRRRTLRPGDVLAEEGEFGTTAFLMAGEGGQVAACVRGAKRPAKLEAADAAAVAKLPKRYGPVVRLLDPDDDELFGEMSLMTNSRRGATLVAVAAGEVFEIDRNVLHLLLRDREVRAVLDRRYAQRAVREFLPVGVGKSRLFSAVGTDSGDAEWVDRFAKHLRQAVGDGASGTLTDTFSEISMAAGGVGRPNTLSDLSVGGALTTGPLIATAVPAPPVGRVQLVRLSPGQVVCRSGDPADNFYLIRTGFVGVEADTPAGVMVRKPLTAGDCFGEVALLMGGRRTATCTALDHAEVVLIPGAVFGQFLDRPENRRVKAAMTARAEALARGTAK